MSTPKDIIFNNLEFSTSDLFRLTEIQDGGYTTDNEKFLLSLVDKFFLRIAVLKDECAQYKQILNDEGLIA